jgi:hypothetical protein
VLITLTHREIYIVRQRSPGTCPYDVVLVHERKHEAADEAVIAEHRRRIEVAAESAISTSSPAGPVPLGQGAALESRLAEAVAVVLRRETAAMGKTRAERQAAIDTPQEYRRVRAACG